MTLLHQTLIPTPSGKLEAGGLAMTRSGRLVVATISVVALALATGPLVGGASADAPQWLTASELTLSGAASNPNAGVYSLACPSQGYCIAAGIYEPSSGGYFPTVASESDGTWAQASGISLPSGAIATLSEQNASFQGAACVSVGNCVAVGSYYDTTFARDAMLATESGGTWGSAVEVTPPTVASSNEFARLTAVTCTGAGDCVAVGDYTDASSDDQAMTMTETDGTWGTAAEITPPTGAPSDADPELESVSCASAGNCVAVGDYYDGSATQAMVVSESGGDWGQATEITQPGDASMSSPSGHLTGVSCTSQGSCVAAGFYRNSDGLDAPMAAAESDGTWSQASVIEPPANDVTTNVGGLRLDSLSCASQGNCVAVGTYYDTSDEFQAMTATESGGTWGQALEFDDLPTGALTGEVDETSQDAVLDSVVCESNSECTAVGSYVDGNLKTQAMTVSTQASGATTAPAITSPSSTTFTAGTAGSFTVEATGTPPAPTLTLSDGGASLPSGVSFVDNGDGTATLSGTPAAGSAGSYPFTITAANGVSPNATQAFTLTVEPAGSAPHPTLSTGTPTGVTATAATLNWTVQPDGDDLYFYTLNCQPSDHGDVVQVTAATVSGSIPADDGVHALATPLTGLRPGITYACGLGMGDNTGHDFSTYPAVEDVTTLTPTFIGFSATPLVTSAQLSWTVNPGGDTLKSYSVACTSSAGNTSVGGSVDGATLPADEASHQLMLNLHGLSPGAAYACMLSLTDADGLVFTDSPRSFSTGSVDVPGTTFSTGAFIAVQGSCGGSTGTVCAGNGEDVDGAPLESPHADPLRHASAASAVVLGRFKFRIKAHHHATIRFELTKAGRKLLLKRHTLSTTLIITVAVHGKKVTTRTPLKIIYRKH
jgi:hypothetical protein